MSRSRAVGIMVRHSCTKMPYRTAPQPAFMMHGLCHVKRADKSCEPRGTSHVSTWNDRAEAAAQTLVMNAAIREESRADFPPVVSLVDMGENGNDLCKHPN